MIDEILKNISEAVAKEIETERVVYIMSQVRKFIERSPQEVHKYPSLKYWCDWVFHTELERSFAKNTLKEMEDYLLANPSDKFHWSEFNMSFVSLDALRMELFSFFRSNNISTDILNLPTWDKFAKKLVEVLKDCPLKKSEGLIREFTFIQKDHIPEYQKYSIDYEIKFDGSRKDLTGSALVAERE